MSRKIEQSDFEVAQVLLQARRAEADILAALVYRGLDRAAAMHVLHLLQSGRSPESLSRSQPSPSKVRPGLARPVTSERANPNAPVTNRVPAFPNQSSETTTPSSPRIAPRRLTQFGICYYGACTVIIIWVLFVVMLKWTEWLLPQLASGRYPRIIFAVGGIAGAWATLLIVVFVAKGLNALGLRVTTETTAEDSQHRTQRLAKLLRLKPTLLGCVLILPSLVLGFACCQIALGGLVQNLPKGDEAKIFIGVMRFLLGLVLSGVVFSLIAKGLMIFGLKSYYVDSDDN